MKRTAVIALFEFQASLRSKGLLVMGGLQLLLAAILAFGLVRAAPHGISGDELGAVTVAALGMLLVYVVPLTALAISFDGISADRDNGQLAMLLAQPVSWHQAFGGKFLGLVAVAAVSIAASVATALGVLLLAGVALTPRAWAAFASLNGTSTLLAAIFVALGLLVSMAIHRRLLAAFVAALVWLFAVLLYDPLLLALVTRTQELLPQGAYATLLLINPADAYRLFTMTITEPAGKAAGGLAMATPPWLPILILATWVALLVSLALSLAPAGGGRSRSPS